MPRTKFPFKYRTNDGLVHTFYASDQETADRYARGWARRLGYRRCVRLRKRSQ